MVTQITRLISRRKKPPISQITRLISRKKKPPINQITRLISPRKKQLDQIKKLQLNQIKRQQLINQITQPTHTNLQQRNQTMEIAVAHPLSKGKTISYAQQDLDDIRKTVICSINAQNRPKPLITVS